MSIEPEEIKEEAKPKTAKNNRRYSEKAFAVEYVKNGMNATQAYKKIRPSVKLSTANVEGTRALAKPSVKREIEALLPKEEETMRVLTDIYNAKREEKIQYKDLFKYWETDLKLRGKLQERNANTTNVAIVIDR